MTIQNTLYTAFPVTISGYLIDIYDFQADHIQPPIPLRGYRSILIDYFNCKSINSINL